MFKRMSAVYLVTTALTIAPALAQSNSSQNVNNAQDFVTKAAEGGMFEIQSSQLALKKSQDRDVRELAQRIIDDHTRADDKLKSIAKNERIPASLDQEHEQLLSKLQGESGSNFVDQYKRMQISAHEQAIDLFQNYAQDGSDQPLKQFAEQTLPTLKQHLQLAQQITIASNPSGTQQTAQNTATQTTGNSAGGSHQFITQQMQGTWRVSKVIGLGVFNGQNQKVGDISDVLVDRNGRAASVVIGVGGFLGLGERNVAVPYDTLRWSMTPVTAENGSAGANNPGGSSATPGAGLGASGNSAPATGTTATRLSDRQNAAYPDHAILANASKDELQNAPQFEYGAAPK